MKFRKFRRVQIPLAAVALGCAFCSISASAEPVKLQPKRVFESVDGIKLPAAVVLAPDGSGRQFLVQQGGKILILPADQSSSEAKVFLDLSSRNMIDKAFEEGLLGLAFHPKFAENGKFYIYHTQQAPKRTRLVEMTVKPGDPDIADPDSERLLLEIPQPFWNHNSGNLVFGPDGLLYIGVGDGGKGGDPLQLGQNLFVLNGSILRIDVDKRDGDLEYGIPADNPFVGKEGCRGEIYASGMRNPWGLSFDQDGHLWCADVGQQKWEEVNLIVKGGNYGWSLREGKDAFDKALGVSAETAKFVDPIHQYGRADGISITGGFVYQGEAIPALKGAYVFGDWGSGTIWAIRCDPQKGDVTESIVLYKRGEEMKKFQPTAITAAPDGEIQVASWNGQIFVLEEAQ